MMFVGEGVPHPEWISRDVYFRKDDEIGSIACGFLDQTDCLLDCFGRIEEDGRYVAG